MISSKEIKSIIDRVIAGNGTDADLGLLQKAVLAGDVDIDGKRNVSSLGHMSRNIIFTGDIIFEHEYSSESLDKLHNEIFPVLPGILPPFPHTVFVGRDEAVSEVKQKLGVTSAKPEVSQIIVHGFPGIGKTTLVSFLSRDHDVARAYPDGILWTSLDQKPGIISIMAGWGRFLGKDNLLENHSKSKVAEQILSLLRNKRMLLIVDDVWEEEHGNLFQRTQAQNCGLIFTTRKGRVAEELAQTEAEIYPLPLFTEEASMKLMRKLAPKVVVEYAEKCRELVNELEHLPLAIHVAAKLLRRRLKKGLSVENLIEEIKEGSRLLEEKAPLDRTEEDGRPTVQALLKKSTDMLSSEMRRHFANLGAFPEKPATFNERAMKFVLNVDDAEPIIEELMDHGLLELTENNRFYMHALLSDHARALRESEFS
jgi:hypothetical protein